ncbi:MAG: catalase-peroxidase, partial [Leptolyngbya sp. SIO1D8]|nr:catalase-peroxidase [Leptolyngbya sp. SIO1D8]
MFLIMLTTSNLFDFFRAYWGILTGRQKVCTTHSTGDIMNDLGSTMSSQPVHSQGGCPFTGATRKFTAGTGTANQDWWPNQLNLKILHQHSSKSNPMGEA